MLVIIKSAIKLWVIKTTAIFVQYSSQVTSRVHALRDMWAREKLARAHRALKELRAKPKPLESWTIANLPARLPLRVLARSWYSPYIKFTSQDIVTCSYNISALYTERDCYERLVGGPVTCIGEVREDSSTSNIVRWNMIELVVLDSWQNVPLALTVHMVSHVRII